MLLAMMVSTEPTTIKLININKNKLFFIIPFWYGLVVRYKGNCFIFKFQNSLFDIPLTSSNKVKVDR